jgi:carboxyl-terminal processing protease
MCLDRRAATALLAACFILTPPPAPATERPATAASLTDSEKIYGLSLFWKEVSDNFAYFDQVPGLDWDGAYREFIPQVLATTSTLEYYQVLQRFSALLEDGHTDVAMPKALRGFWDTPGLAVTEVDRRAIVTNVTEELRGRVALGSEIVAVDGLGTKEYLTRNVIPYISTSAEHVRWSEAIAGNPYTGYGLLYGPPNSFVTITLLTPDGEGRDLTLARNVRVRQNESWVKPADERGPELQQWRWLEKGVLYVRFNSFGDENLLDQFRDEVVPQLPRARGVVIDLRYNPGGSTYVGARILDYFIDEPVRGAATHRRVHDSYRYAIGKAILDDPELERRLFEEDAGSGDEDDDPEVYKRTARGQMWRDSPAWVYEPTDGPKFLVPVVVLTGYHTASAAEDFLVLIDGLDRFTTVGEPSYGSTGQPVVFQLPGGGRARVCTKRDTFADGRVFVGFGVQPEVPVKRTVASVLGEEDAVLDAGVRVLKSMMAGGPRSD